MPNNCALCGAENPENRCSRCHQVYYCNAECQRSHWKAHKPDCKQQPPPPAPQPVQSAGSLPSAVPGTMPTSGVKKGLASPRMLPKDCRISVRPTLEECVETWNQRNRSPFYPCAPPWVRNPDKFIKSLNIPGGGMFDIVTANIGRQRRLDTRWRPLQKYGYPNGKGNELLPLSEHKKILEKFGWCLPSCTPANEKEKKTLQQVVSGGYELMKDWKPSAEVAGLPDVFECDHCHRAIHLASPPECICGEIYCSVQCHNEAWKDHREICETVQENALLDCTLTRDCWEKGVWPHVRVGRTPITEWTPPAVPADMRLRAEIELNRGHPIPVSRWGEEYDYYDANERILLKDRMLVLQDLTKNAAHEGRNAEAQQLQALCLTDLMWQLRYYSREEEKDSVGRIMFRASVLMNLENIFTQMNIPVKAELKQCMKELMEEAAKRGVKRAEAAARLGYFQI